MVGTPVLPEGVTVARTRSLSTIRLSDKKVIHLHELESNLVFGWTFGSNISHPKDLILEVSRTTFVETLSTAESGAYLFKNTFVSSKIAQMCKKYSKIS